MLKYIDENVFNAIRMISAMFAGIIYFIIKSIFEIGYFKSSLHSIKIKKTPVFHCFMCGILFLGIPVSLTTISQQTIPSVIITLSQPCIPFFTMIFAHFAFTDEKITINKLYIQVVALIGALLTLVPTINPETSSKKFVISHYMMLFVSLILYGLGSVYIKLFLSKSDSILTCTLSIIGAGIYTMVSSMSRMSVPEFVFKFSNLPNSTILYSVIIGIIFNFFPTYMSLYIIKALGAVKANLTTFGQIVIGIVSGVCFLDEWKDYSLKDKILNYFGIFQITITLLMDFYSDMKPKECLNDEKSRNEHRSSDDDQYFPHLQYSDGF